MSKLSNADISHIANLARLDISQKEKTLYSKKLSVVFDYIDMLNEVDTEDVAETCQVTGLMNIFREDEVKEISSEKRDALLKCFPSKMGDYLKVKTVFENN